RTWKSLEQKIDMPHVAGISDVVKGQYKKEGIRDYNPEIIKDILYCFLEKGINNTKIFTSEKYEAAFPYTSFNIAQIARELYKAYGGREAEESKSSENDKTSTKNEVMDKKKNMEFLFGSFQLVSHGNQFTFTEEVLSQIFKELPHDIEKIERGEEPNEHEIYILGSPTTTTGTMSTKFLDEVKNNAFETYGDMYAELVESIIPKKEKAKTDTNVMFHGISMGASFAGQTAKKILEDGRVTQSRENSELPFLQVRIDTAPGHRNTPGIVGKLKTFGGFAISTAYSLSTDKYLRNIILKNGKYMEQVDRVLAEKNLAKSNLTPEQLKMKKSAIGLVENALAEGVPWPEGVKATEVVGLRDLLTYSTKTNKDAYGQIAENPDSLGTNIVPEQGNENIRVRSAKMTHAIPFTQRENEQRRMFKAVRSLEELHNSRSDIANVRPGT
ncbi:MAG: hypothetical protein KGJ35_03015, partial [Patescibacteria group bacterium]|nr:hypothetical protein [Patescibacteria group bacterium]